MIRVADYTCLRLVQAFLFCSIRIMAAPYPYTTYDLSGFLAVPFSLKNLYQSYWTTFERVQAYNIGISTLRNAGDTSKGYYIYQTYQDQNAYTIGRLLHIKRYPESNWNPVPND